MNESVETKVARLEEKHQSLDEKVSSGFELLAKGQSDLLAGMKEMSASIKDFAETMSETSSKTDTLQTELNQVNDRCTANDARIDKQYESIHDKIKDTALIAKKALENSKAGVDLKKGMSKLFAWCGVVFAGLITVFATAYLNERSYQESQDKAKLEQQKEYNDKILELLKEARK